MILVLASIILSMVVAASALPFTLNARGATTWEVDISGFNFVPSTRSILLGDTVIWTNNDGTPHTVTSTDGTGELDSGDIADSGTYSHLFASPGVFTYRCELHPSMTGSVAVDTVIPEFSGLPFVMLGVLALVVGLMVVRRKA